MKKAEENVRLFLQAWKQKDWQAMYETCQLTWRSNQLTGEGDPVGLPLVLLFGEFPIEGFEVTPIEQGLPAVFDCTVSVKVRGRWTYPVKVRSICENRPYLADAKGQWGVNPISALRIFSNPKKI